MYENYTVLFVDDEPNILSSIRRGLMDEEYHCLFAESGAQALDIMQKERVAVIVTDMRMPEIDGLHLLLKIKEQWPRTVRIVLSGYTQLQQILATINQADVFKFITKPWKMEEEFKQIIYQALDYYKVVDENEEYKNTLQNRNIAYQNILKNLDVSMLKAKKSIQIMGTACYELLRFNKEYLKELDLQTLDYEENIFSNMILCTEGEDSQIACEVFEEHCKGIIESKIPITRLNKSYPSQLKIMINLNSVSGMILAAVGLFEDIYKKYGLYVNIGYNQKDTNFIISMFSINVEEFEAEKVREHISMDQYQSLLINRESLDKRIELINRMVGSCFDPNEINFCAKKHENNLATMISFKLTKLEH